ncbi:hypothetical protein K469DRAFT_709346 [Zopfia rhizophila CBS 207.26]|uniref:DUF1772-domain-containing protein n=1 Tax=Zopfia rhizophila CBS 207.26 TaxID=1314779 RepID=A0A6A6ESA5_9PEZI|nr:hypothetical protein K469DRAFT_709346 [Zopfia rhizophila CBS 207.26]
MTLQSVTAELFARNGLPLKLIRVFPLILSTVLLVQRIAQFYAITTFMPPHMPHPPANSPAAKRFNPSPVLKIWMRTAVARVFPGVLAVVFVMRLALLANILIRPSDLAVLGSARALYGVGLALSFAHLPIAPAMLKLENAMKSPQTADDEMLVLLERWFKVNNVRIWVTDFPLWLVSIAALLTAFKL